MVDNRPRVVLASPHERHDALEQRLREQLRLEVCRVRVPEELEPAHLAAFAPRYVFFPHWSWKIPPEIHERFECVIFHMTDLPFGRGGSPLQNLVARGFEATRLTALRCVAELDAGPVYLKRPLSLLGSAEEIFLRAAHLTADMIECIVREQPDPVPQVGEATVFRRRRPAEGDLSQLDTLEKLFDHIRMLDAQGYPAAFIETAHFKLEFSRASLRADGVIADVRITRKNI